MSKVAKPLTIVVFPPLDEWPEIVKLEKQGHTIVVIPKKVQEEIEGICAHTLCKAEQDAIVEADIILGPRCWYLTELHRKHLQAAIKQARLRRYGTITKKRKKGDNDEKENLETFDLSPDPESDPGC